MTTTPTVWKTEQFFASGPGISEPQVTALAGDGFFIGYDFGNDIAAFAADPLANSFSSDLMAGLSDLLTKPLSGPQFVQQTDGHLVVEFRSTFSITDNDILWHPADPGADPVHLTDIDSSSNDRFLHDATATAGGGSAVIWEQPSVDGIRDFQALQFVDAQGVVSTGPIFMPIYDGQSQLDPAIAGIFNGNVAVAFENFTAATADRDIRLHIFTPTGQDIASGPNGTHEIAVSGGGKNAAFPDIALTNGNTPDVPGDGSIVVVWQDNNGIEYRRFGDDTGSPIDTDPRMIAGSAGGLLPHVAALNDGGFIVEWGQAFGQEQDGSADFDIVLQRFDINGNAVGDKFFIDNPGDQGPFNVSLTTLADGRVVAFFSNETGDSTNATTLDYVILDPRETTINGTNEDDTIVGRLDASTINGLSGNDHLTGMTGNDVLKGGDGIDVLTGGLGRDMLSGGANSDFFDFNSIKDSKVKAPDVIRDFHHNDGIDLSDIDANTKKNGIQKFHFIGIQNFHHKVGELHYVKQLHNHVFVEGDVNGDGRADFRIDVHGTNHLTAHDFILMPIN